MSAGAVSGRVEVAGIVLARIRDHGPECHGLECHWCGTWKGAPHEAGCLWLEVVAATDRPADDLGLPGGGTTT